MSTTIITAAAPPAQLRQQQLDAMFERMLQNMLPPHDGYLPPPTDAVSAIIASNLQQNRALQSTMLRPLFYKYVEALEQSNARPKQVAFELGQSVLHVWALIDDDDDCNWNAMLSVESTVVVDFTQYGIDIETNVIEVRDGMDVPQEAEVYSFSGAGVS